jgi:hypothetical protein
METACFSEQLVDWPPVKLHGDTPQQLEHQTSLNVYYNYKM